MTSTSEPVCLLTISEAAHRLAVSARTVRRLIATGDLPSVHIRSARRILESDLASYIDRAITSRNNADGVTAKGTTPCHAKRHETRTAFTNAQTRPSGGSAYPMPSGAALAAVLGFPSTKTPRV